MPRAGVLAYGYFADRSGYLRTFGPNNTPMDKKALRTELEHLAAQLRSLQYFCALEDDLPEHIKELWNDAESLNDEIETALLDL